MIISASRRTDIPGFYSDWFLHRLRTGEAIAPNPFNPRQLGRVRLTPDAVDCIVFWTKNAQPMLAKLPVLDAMGYRYYFTFTVTPYGTDLEKRLPPKKQVADTFRELSDRLGPKRVDWRFDPIVVTERYTEEWHFDMFARMCRLLGGHTERCIINFVKTYRRLASRVKELDDEIIRRVAAGFAAIAREHGVALYNCTEKWNLEKAGINFSACIDKKKIEEITGYPITVKKDPGQPPLCRCAESFDVGMYSTCEHGCTYCYALNSEKKLARTVRAHEITSPMLSGFPCPDDAIKDRTRPSFRSQQKNLFEGVSQGACDPSSPV